MQSIAIKELKNGVVRLENGNLYIEAEDINFGTPEEQKALREDIAKGEFTQAVLSKEYTL